MMANSLYLISTPIGNREDITLRALKSLFSADILLCEDTRKTSNLLNFYQQEPYLGTLMNHYSTPKLVSFHEHNEETRIPQVLSWLKKELIVGLVSNAGTPTISDPGFKLVRQCQKEGYKVVGIPGASASTTALSISGLPTDKFLFLGFLPKKPGKKKNLLKKIQETALGCTVIIYESPLRICKTLKIIKDIFGDIEVVLARELTKLHEQVDKKPASHWLKNLSAKKLKGEIVILFHRRL